MASYRRRSRTTYRSRRATSGYRRSTRRTSSRRRAAAPRAQTLKLVIEHAPQNLGRAMDFVTPAAAPKRAKF